MELERLLPKNNPRKSEDRLELVNRGGCTYFVPADRDVKINNIRRWEQAFRVYATIYSGANPSRAVEIWQYVHVINTAASAYQWENVANYDYTFRQLMAFNPERSWAKCYHQMWNLSMRDPLFRQQGNYSYGNSNSVNNSSSFNRNDAEPKKNKSDYCWDFNKGRCTNGASCKWKNKCKYCDSTEHGVNVCPKLEAKKKKEGNMKRN